MINPRWKKVLRDLWNFKTRTLLVVISIAVGVFAFGTIVVTRANVLQGLQTQFLAINPESATIRTDPFDADLVDRVRRVPGVAAAEGVRIVPARIEVAPNVWDDIDLHVLPDDGIRTVNIVTSEAGIFPPPDNAILIERAAIQRLPLELGDTVPIQLAGTHPRTLPIAGLTHDLSLPPAPVAGKAFGYITMDTLVWLGGQRGYNQIQFVVAEQPRNEAHIWQVAAAVADRIERSGRTVIATEVPVPLQHPAEDILQTIMLILGSQGFISLLLSAFLIINTIGAILTQQTRQIGIMKSVGATARQITLLYLGMMFMLGVFALLLAVPLGYVGARAFSTFLANQLNFDLVNFRIPMPALVLQAAAALLLPALTALPLIHGAARITVRQALDNHAGTAPTNTGIIDRLIERVRGLSRPMLLSLRNTFRRKGRLMRTVAALTLAGAIFISVVSVRASLGQTLDDAIATRYYDVEVQLGRSYRAAEIEHLTRQVLGVVNVEGWGLAGGVPVRADGSEGEEVRLYAPPADTALFDPIIEAGRWLLPDDERAIVVSSNYLIKEPDAHLGATIVLKIDDVEHAWRIVGISRETSPPANPARAYINYPAFTRAASSTGHVSSLQVVGTTRDAATQLQLAQQLERHFDQHNISVRLIRTTESERALLTERFNILTAVLSVMALLIGTVGALGLMGTMSINVLERTREIGIMRAVGASDAAIRQIVLTEGILIGMLAWLSGVLVSLSVSRFMSTRIGYALLNQPLSYRYAAWAVLLWLLMMLVLAAGASLVPASNAARMTVREVLAYE